MKIATTETNKSFDIADRLKFIGLDEHDSEILRSMKPLVEREPPVALDNFCEKNRVTPEFSRFFTSDSHINGVTLVNETGEAPEKIVVSVNDINNHAGAIVAPSNEQSIGCRKSTSQFIVSIRELSKMQLWPKRATPAPVHRKKM
ncbi:MAG: hypothetical protein GY761_06995 [Hyphomicrobiales bacterium]|nr:hypothetical protein [Hyphomicrobiales bacterium]